MFRPTRLFRVLAVVFAAALLVSGCQGAQPAKEAPLRLIRFGYTSTPDVNSLPSFLAMESLREKGYDVVPVFIAEDSQAIQAVLAGDVAFSDASVNQVLAAIQQGADLKEVYVRARSDQSLVASMSIQSGSDLHGKKIAISDPGSSSTAMIQQWFKENFPEAQPELVIVGSSDVRAQAMLSGQVDATSLELGDILALQKERPGDFHVLAPFATQLPKIQWEMVFTSGKYIKENPDVVDAIIEAELLSNRRVYAEPDYLMDRGYKYVSDRDPADLQEVLNAYRETNFWTVDGGLTDEEVQYNIDFFVNSGSLEPGLTVAQVADRSPLDRVLKRIGSK